MTKHFSIQTKELLGEANFIAHRLGKSEISTIHFFLADSEKNGTVSIRNFIFPNPIEYKKYYDEQILGEQNIINDVTTDMTNEAEKCIRKAALQLSSYVDREIQPYHLFLAAAKVEECLLFSNYLNKTKLLENLENYYIELGILKKENIKRGFVQKLNALYYSFLPTTW